MIQNIIYLLENATKIQTPIEISPYLQLLLIHNKLMAPIILMKHIHALTL